MNKQIIFWILMILGLSFAYFCKTNTNNECIFEMIESKTITSRTDGSVQLSNDLSLELKKLPNEPIKGKNILEFGGKYNYLISKYSNTPIDTFLAGSLNAFIGGVICPTFIMSEKTKDTILKKQYEAILLDYFKKLGNFAEAYTNGQNLNIFQDISGIPTKIEPSTQFFSPTEVEINRFFTDQINNSKKEVDREFWKKRKSIIENYLRDCKEQRSEDCIKKLWDNIQKTYSHK
jgi:hypothetical protein